MHLLLTDTLSCPRCGPEFGLILLARRVEERRILEGELGCPNCRARYPVEAGFGDLRAPPRDPLPTAEGSEAAEGEGVAGPPARPDASAGPSEEALRIGALLGVERGPGRLVLVGAPAEHAGALASMIEDVEVVVVGARHRTAPEREGVSRIAATPRLPFFTRTVRAVGLAGGTLGGGAGLPEDLLAEAARVVAPMGRVVVLDAPDGTGDRLENAGLRVALEEAGTVVAVRE